MQDGPYELPSALHTMRQECDALICWLRSLPQTAWEPPLLRLHTAARRPLSGVLGGSGAPGGMQAAAGSSSRAMAASRFFTVGATGREAIEHSLCRAAYGAEVLDLHPPEAAVQQLVLEHGAILHWWYKGLSPEEVLRVKAGLQRIGALLSEAAAAAGASVHVMESRSYIFGSQIACIAPDSVWVLTIDV